MLKPKYGNEVAFVMGNIVASYGGQLEKKAQLNLSNQEEDTGGPVDLGHTVSDTIDELDTGGDPTSISSRFEETSGEDFGSARGDHVSLFDQDSEIAGLEATELAYKDLMKDKTPLAGDTKMKMPGSGLPVRENPFGTETVKIDFDANDPANLFRDPTKPASAGVAPEDLEMDLMDWDDIPESEPVGVGPVRSSLILDKIEKIAAYLGDRGDVRSELIAGDLLMSVIKNINKLNK